MLHIYMILIYFYPKPFYMLGTPTFKSSSILVSIAFELSSVDSSHCGNNCAEHSGFPFGRTGSKHLVWTGKLGENPENPVIKETFVDTQ